MLVDNGVNGDSRVQKAARSAAEAGWEVTLLGRSPVTEERTWKLGDATVRLLAMPAPLARRRHEFRRAWLRWPLAYPPSGIAAHRAQAVKAWRADLAVRAAEIAVADPGTPGLALRRRVLTVQQAAAKAAGKWVSLRYWMLTRARTRRKFRNPWDRAYTMFWQAVKGDGAWRRLEPGLWDYELAYGPVVDELAPDLIHANDFRMLGVGARAKIRAAAAGRDIKLVWDAHEFLPGLKPWQDNARWLPAHTAHEREYAPYADAVMTVSDGLAELLQREHRLAVVPDVVLNAPAVEHDELDPDAPAPDLRKLCGIGPEVPLLVYSGAAARQRGLDVMVEALPKLPGVHVALVVNKPAGPYVSGVLARARKLGVGDRVHALPYVAHWQVVPFLSGADAGVIPIHHWPNHEIALITKFFEYSHGRLPLIVSDVKTMAGTVRSTGQGEVFRAEDVADYIRAVRAVLADPQRYRAAYDRAGLLRSWTWEAQAQVLDGVYRRLLPGRPAVADHLDEPVPGDPLPALGVGT
ncbi:glycosyltransferase family 4 protein [Micromonospora peucetia]|uniref:Glycosyltransferase family 4 protein n=2 Tax=Micromonospora peucetia TaxID=47871 RepID=A0A1C6W620_9ACTN|nr:glycosyltransferase family 4 protein [Micromonospora peucetia]MCX4385618.1 glycosyltransferase family 4 protein [Micromonospora peucetia]WSA35527.1 glycosyltransferase family 4 protein [Micromonospora peucetia]SCL74015.1 Glycosyltransferase involved in cell wall bisynthesis [Micromonospora peucetia]